MLTFRWRFVVASLGAILLVSLMLVPESTADTWGGCSTATESGCRPDSTLHTYCYGAGFNSTLEDEADFAMNTSIARDTVMTASFYTTCSTADIKWLDANLGSTRGDYICLEPFSPFQDNGTCLASRVRLNPTEINQGPNDPEDRKKTACHEAGHSIGFQHGDDKTDCMINGPIPDTTDQWRTFGGHHITHIADFFG